MEESSLTTECFAKTIMTFDANQSVCSVILISPAEEKSVIRELKIIGIFQIFGRLHAIRDT